MDSFAKDIRLMESSVKESSTTKQFHQVVPPSSTTNKAYVASKPSEANEAMRPMRSLWPTQLKKKLM